MAWGVGYWGAGGGWGGVDRTTTPFSISGAYASSTGTIQIILTQPANTISSYTPGSATNPDTWIVVDTQSGLTLDVGVVFEVAPDKFDLYIPGGTLGGDITYTVETTTLISAAGELISGDMSFSFKGIDVDPTAKAGKQSKLIDIANSPVPYNPVGGTLEVGSNGDYRSVSGATLLKKLILRRLYTIPGEFFHLPKYGLGLRAKQLINPHELVTLKQQVLEAVYAEPEVAEAKATLTLSNTGVLTVAIQARMQSSNEWLSLSYSDNSKVLV